MHRYTNRLTGGSTNIIIQSQLLSHFFPLTSIFKGLFVGWLLACLTSRQHASVFQGRNLQGIYRKKNNTSLSVCLTVCVSVSPSLSLTPSSPPPLSLTPFLPLSLPLSPPLSSPSLPLFLASPSIHPSVFSVCLRLSASPCVSVSVSVTFSDHPLSLHTPTPCFNMYVYVTACLSVCLYVCRYV